MVRARIVTLCMLCSFRIDSPSPITILAAHARFQRHNSKQLNESFCAPTEPATHDMRRTASGRVARKIGAYDEDAADSTDSSQSGPQKGESATQIVTASPLSDPPRNSVLTYHADAVVKRPTFGKNKKRSSLRISFGAGDSDSNGGDESSDTGVITPKRPNLSRIAIENNAERNARSPRPLPELPRPPTSLDEDRPTYSRDYIDELRKSTPATPKDLTPTPDEEDESQAIDIASKFGPSATLSAELTSSIPTDAEIQEKKARRARLAQEKIAHEDEDQPWASDDDDEFRTSRNEISLRPKEKYAETRLVRDDEDIAEGFEDYVEDESIALGRKAEREAEKRRRDEMATLINAAEGESDDDRSDDSEEVRNAAYEAAQTRAGRYGQREHGTDDGARTPPRITPLPDLGEVLEGLQADVRLKELRREMILKKMEELREEKVRIAERQTYLQEQLQKTGDEYEKLRQEAGMAAVPANGTEVGKFIVNRGLDSLGTTPVVARSEEGSDEE
jgi:hypothetical protein